MLIPIEFIKSQILQKLSGDNVVRKNLFFLLTTQMVNYIFPLLTMKYLIITIGVVNFGKISFAQAFLLYFTIITDYGFNITATRDIARNSKSPDMVARIVGSVYTAKFLLLLLCTFIYITIIFLSEKFYTDFYLYLLFWGVVIGSCLFPQWYFQGIQRLGQITIVNVVIKILLLLSVFVVVNKKNDYIYVPLIYSASFIIAGIYAAMICLKDCHYTHFIQLSDSIKAFKDGFPIFISSSMSVILNGSSVFIMGFIVTEELIGYYSGFDKIIRACLLLFAPITTAIYPHVSELMAQQKVKAVKYIKNAAKYTLLLAIVIALFIIIASDFIIPLMFSVEFLNYKIVLYILSVWMIFSVGNNFIGVQYLTCVGQSKLYAKLMTTCGIITIIMIFLLTKRFSCYGTAYAIVIGELLLTATMLGSIKLKKPRRKIRSTSNNSKRKNFKYILNRIKAQSIKANFNLINKQNIIHHHITNITNMTQKNYYSNVIINNFRNKDDNKNNTINKNKSKNVFDMSTLKIDKILNIKANVNQIKKQPNNNWKFKNNLQKLIMKDENILKNSVKYKTLNNTINNIDEERKSQSKSNNKNTKTKKLSKDKELGSRTIPANSRKNKHYKIKAPFINNFSNLDGNKMNKKKIYLNMENSIRNSSINKEKLDKKDFYNKNLLNEKKCKIFLTDINFEEEIANRSKINYVTSVEISHSNRSYNKKCINSFDKKRKITHNNISKRIYKSINQNIENKKNILKNIIKNKNLNIKNITGNNNNNAIKMELKSIKNQYQVNSQRNKPNMINNNKKYIGANHYMNSARINDQKIINNSYNIGNSHYVGNLTENVSPFLNNNNNLYKKYKFKTSQNNVRNKISLNNHYNHLNKNFLFNFVNDNLKLNKNSSLLHSNNDYNSVLFNKNINNSKQTIAINKNYYLDKFNMSKKLLASLRKRSNIKSILINNIFEKKLVCKTQKNSKNKKKIKNENNKNINNNSLIVNLPYNVKQIKVNNNVDNTKKISKKTSAKKNETIKYNAKLYNSLEQEKNRHKKIKSMKNSVKIKQKKNCEKINNHSKYLNIDNINRNSIGTNPRNIFDMNSNLFYSNIISNSLDHYFKFTK